MNAFRKCALIYFLLLVPRIEGAQLDAWIATWAASPTAANLDGNGALLKIEDQTVRERIRVSIGGVQIRIRLSNEFGSSPLRLGSATVAAPIDPSTVKEASIRTVTFGGQHSVTIPAGAPVLSDPVSFPVLPGAEISISLYFPARVASPTIHALALKRAVVSQKGDYTHAERIAVRAASKSSILISAVLVSAQPFQKLIVTFGDSLTDGDGSTLDADRNWPSDLVRRLDAAPKGARVAVVNAGLVGNRLLRDAPWSSLADFGTSALARFDQDALALPGITHVVLLEGINDIGFPGKNVDGRNLADAADVRTTEELIGAYRQLISRAHARGVKMVGATITPFEGADLLNYTAAGEATRQRVNKWIRSSGSFDGIIDFDAVVRDSDHPSRLLSKFDSGDHLHPNDAGYQAMADAIKLTLFK